MQIALYTANIVLCKYISQYSIPQCNALQFTCSVTHEPEMTWKGIFHIIFTWLIDLIILMLFLNKTEINLNCKMGAKFSKLFPKLTEVVKIKHAHNEFMWQKHVLLMHAYDNMH